MFSGTENQSNFESQHQLQSKIHENTMKTTQKIKKFCGLFLLSFLGMAINAQDLPGNTSLVSSDEELLSLTKLDEGDYRYTVEDYFGNPKGFTFRFSPDGKYLSYRERDENGKQHIYVKNLATGEAKMAIEEKDELVRGYGWLNNQRLYYIMDKGGNENYHIYAVNLDGDDLKDLTPFEGVQSSVYGITSGK